MEEFGITAFRSRQQVMRFEDILRREGIATRIISTPRGVSAGCGLSVRFAVDAIPAVQDALSRVRPSNLIGLYHVAREGGRTRLTAYSRPFSARTEEK